MSKKAQSNSFLDRLRSSTVTQHVLPGWLPIVVVGALIFLLSGGFPPTAWVLLVNIFSKWDALQAARGGGAVLSLIIALAQSLLILLAWVMLIAVTVYEIRAIRNQHYQERQSLQMEQISLPVQASAQADDVAESWAKPNEPVPQPPFAKVARDKQSDVDEFPDNPFEEKQEESSNRLVSRPKQQRNIEGSNRDAQQAGDVEDEGLFSGKVFAQSLVMNPDDPFSAQHNVLDFFLAADPPSPAAAEPAGGGDEEEEEGPTFVYGNPFEGDMPEVFAYDMDLRRSMEELQEELREKEQATRNRTMKDLAKHAGRGKVAKDLAKHAGASAESADQNPGNENQDAGSDNA